MRYTLKKTSYVFNARGETNSLVQTYDADSVFDLIAIMSEVIQDYASKYKIKIENDKERKYVIFDVPAIEETVKFEFMENEE